ncbi:hypothetical protein P5G51_017275 [Virgibacillus sp. 179-BFC.A HS]|uniref:DRBM domain-containing protein n=1 Tax=Tigheibacillus jepli TaxID=3035914 RepID=A0ABU5CM32_9BACI|nr:hypothetical protein [Virgibacillus sp. 179-BFC.A HS]MDY0406872.1 hypothetical protein [Virgibacillus sp. 179-BFC.A HS]
MVGCLVLYHTDITSLTKSKMLRYCFHGKDYEIVVEDGHSVSAFIWNLKRNELYQTALLFECSGLCTGYGFGDNKEMAHQAAWNILIKRALLEKQNEKEEGSLSS